MNQIPYELPLSNFHHPANNNRIMNPVQLVNLTIPPIITDQTATNINHNFTTSSNPNINTTSNHNINKHIVAILTDSSVIWVGIYNTKY